MEGSFSAEDGMMVVESGFPALEGGVAVGNIMGFMMFLGWRERREKKFILSLSL